MKTAILTTALFAFALAIPTSSNTVPSQPKAYCETPAVLDAKTNVFLTRTLHPNSIWRSFTLGAAQNITDPELKKRALKAMEQGTFTWIEKPEHISRIEEVAKDVPCNHILGLVLAGLPYKNCPVVSFPPATDPWSYEDLFLKPIVSAIEANPNVAFAVIIEPGVIGEMVNNLKLNSCEHVRRTWRQNVPLALKNLELPNVVTYLDASHGGWLGWKDVQLDAAREIANTWMNAGELKQFRGLAANVASYNSWDMSPGEIFEGENTCYDILNPARNEKRHLDFIRRSMGKLNVSMPLHGIVDTSRNGVTGIRRHWTDWCNIVSAGFGRSPSSDTKDSNMDAFVWVKNGGISDGTSDPSLYTYDSSCGQEFSFKPMPEKGQFSQAYFEMLLREWNERGFKRSTGVPRFEVDGAQMCANSSPSRSFAP